MLCSRNLNDVEDQNEMTVGLKLCKRSCYSLGCNRYGILVNYIMGAKPLRSLIGRGIDYDEVFAPVARIEAIRLSKLYMDYIKLLELVSLGVYEFEALMKRYVADMLENVTPKTSHRNACVLKSIALMKYCDKHNQVGFLKKPEESTGFAEIVDFLKGSHISKLQLADASGISMLPNTEIFEGMGNMGYPAYDQSSGTTDQAEDQPSSFAPLPSSSHPPVISTEHIFEQPSPEHQPLSPRQETEVPQSQDPTHTHVPEARTMTVEDLLHLVPNLIIKVDSLEIELKQTKLTMGKAIVKLVKKVKKLEAILKRRHVVLTDSEDEEPEDQGRIIQDIDDDPLGSKGDFVTPTKPSGEAQEEEISPTTLEEAKILSKVASQKSKSVDKGKRYKRRKESKGKDISIGLEDVSTGFEKVNTGGLGVSISSRPVSSARGQKEGKAPMIVEETQAPKRTKEQIQQEEAIHYLTLEACSIYMLAYRKYPLSKDACQVMLKMKLLDGKMNEVCYKLLKMIEKQAGAGVMLETVDYNGREKGLSVG
ncbi:hypothetical protein Tco_0567492 [Tanacetum coccineum]